MPRPLVVGIGGFTSNVGKTTLVCELLKALPGWEAIKTTRGHYRSCGKDPLACCVSHLLGEEPLIRSGRDQTYEVGKDTGRFWDAGAKNVHWVVATDDQVEKGIKEALSRVSGVGVLVEGNSFARFIPTDCFVMVRRSSGAKMKKTAKRVLSQVTAVYVSDDSQERKEQSLNESHPTVFTRSSLPLLITQLRNLTLKDGD
jgi:molybdopterin-guanine dinucleotide biosynthesis protein